MHSGTFGAGWFRSGQAAAIKKLRPGGNKDQRIRVIAVSQIYFFLTVSLPSLLSQAVARELRVWSQLDHPNILKLLGFYVDENEFSSAWIVTPWQSNGDIATYLQIHKPSKVRRFQLVSLSSL